MAERFYVRPSDGLVLTEESWEHKGRPAAFLSTAEVGNAPAAVQLSPARTAAVVAVEIVNVSLVAAPSGAGAVLVTAQTRDSAGSGLQTVLELAAFTDDGCTEPVLACQFSGATQGAILAGTGSPAVKVRTDAAGRFSATLRGTLRTTAHVAAGASFGSPLLDCRERVTVNF